jgi:hypothetical protein
VAATYAGPKLKHDDAIFAMGSCFAREIESALIKQGGRVISIDKALIDRPEFHDANGEPRGSFFHRFTPRALWHEFMIAFDRLEGWDPESSLLFESGRQAHDMNYWNVEGSDLSREATMVRRRIAGELVRRASEAKVIILTLGLTEGWVHTPSGFHINRFVPMAARNRDEFAFEEQDFQDVVRCLNQIHRLLTRCHKTGDFQLVVTVSPVPLQTTFTAKDVIVANMDSKATLRAAAAEFVSRHDNAHYFPSYEIVMYSGVKAAWKPDRLHVTKGMVAHVVSQFVEAYYDPGPDGVQKLVAMTKLASGLPFRVDV